MTKTFKDLLDFNEVVNELYKKTPEMPNTKFGYALKRFTDKNIVPAFKEYGEKMADIRIENALTDEKTKAVILDANPRGFAYSKEGLQAVVKAERELEKSFETKEFTIEPYISSEAPESLTQEQVEIFTGLVI